MQGPPELQGQGQTGIAKNCTWKILFFSAAVCVLAAGIISIVMILASWEWAPMTLTSEVYLVIFGLMMVVLDFPIPHPNRYLAQIRYNIYRFALFMTRFTGRGLWYCFLGTLVWMALCDQDKGFVGNVLGGFLGLWPVTLGIVTFVYGLFLSTKLNRVRTEILSRGGASPVPNNGLTLVQFADFLETHDAKLKGDEVMYALNGLSFTPENDNVLSAQEFKVWLSPGRLPIL